MKRILSLLILLSFSLVAHAEIFWAGVWYDTKSPTPSDRLQGPLEVRLATNGTIEATFIRKLGKGFNSDVSTNSGTWTLKQSGIYHLSFTSGGYLFTGIIRNNLMTGTFGRTGPRRNEAGSIYYAGRFQCTLFNDED